MMRKVIIYILTLLTLLAAGCGSEQPQPKELQLCSSMGTKLTEVIADSYSKAAGVKVNISYLPGGTQQERLDYLRKHRFDVWLGGTSEEYFMADEQHILQPYIAKESYKVPAELRNRTGQWTSLYLSYIALLSNKTICMPTVCMLRKPGMSFWHRSLRMSWRLPTLILAVPASA